MQAASKPRRVTKPKFATGGRAPEANIAIATGAMSGVLVVDVDDAEGALLLIDLMKQFGALPMTLQAKTGKGVHFYFALPDSCGRVPSSKGDGLDIRADGGYVLAPPSIHPSGARYEWVEGVDECAAAPDWLIDFARDRKAVSEGRRVGGEVGCAIIGSPERRKAASRHLCPGKRPWRIARPKSCQHEIANPMVRRGGSAASIRACSDPRRQSGCLAEGRLRSA